MTDHCENVSRMSTILKPPLASETPLYPGKTRQFWLKLAASKLSHMASFARLPPKKIKHIWSRLTEGRTSLHREDGWAHPERALKSRTWAFWSWRVIHKETTDIRSDLGALLCWSVKKWRWLWQSALNDAISLLMRCRLHSRLVRGKRMRVMGFCVSTWQMCWKPAEQQNL